MYRLLALAFFLQLAYFPLFGQGIQKIDSLNESSFTIRSLHRDSSRALAYEALALSNKVRYKKGIARSQLNLAIHYCNTNKLDSASKYIDLAYEYFLSSKEKHYLGIGAWYKGKIYQRLSNFKRAFNYLGIAEEIFQKEGNYTYLIYVLTEQGVYYEMQNNYPKALEYYLKASKLKEGNSVEVSMRENSNIASVYSKMGMFDEALKYAREALNNAYTWGRKDDIVEGLYTIGKIFQKQGNDDSTLYYYNKSYENVVQNELLPSQATILPEIAKFYQDKNEYKKAIDYLLRAEKIGVDYTLPPIYLSLSTNYDKRGLQDSSLYYVRKASRLAEQRGNVESLLSASEMLMNFYESRSVLDSALFYSKKVLLLSDSIYNESRNKRFDNLKVQLETLEKENEINALKLTQYESKVRNRIFIVVAIFLFLTVLISFWIYRVSQRRKHQILEYKRQQLEKQLEISQRKLSNHTLSMIQKNNVFEEINSEIKEIRLRCKGNIDPGLKKIQNDINLSRSLENDWDNFSSLFGELHSTFFKYFEKQHPELSDYELRLCALIKMRLTNKEIATMLNIEHKSVKMAKYRLKKKLGIGEDVALSDFIARID